jgi:hypothetical protein
MANPVYQAASPTAGDDIYASAGSIGGTYGEGAGDAAAAVPSSSRGQPFSNPLAGGGEEEEEEGGQNPLFASQSGTTRATNLSFKPAGLKK